MTPFLPYPKELLLQIQVLAMRYLDKPTARMEEQMLVLLADAIRRHCENIVFVSSETEDLEQVARIAATKALRTYNPVKGSFYRWSRRCIYGDIANHFRTEGVLIRIPRNLQGKVTIEYVSWQDLDAGDSDDECDD